MREFAADRRSDLRDVFGGSEPVEPRHQRRMQACGDYQGRRRNCADDALSSASAPRLQYRLGYLFHEQRNAVGALDDVLPDVCWKNLVADYTVNHGVDVALRQPIDGDR